jgi:hypothetical protein
MATVQLDKSTYLDFTGYRFTDEPTVAKAYNLPSGTVTTATTAYINVAIVLDRKQDPTSLLAEDWGTRQKALANLDSSGTLWTTYGADKAQFDHVRHELETTYGFTVLDGTNPAANGDYVTSAESRTIWIEVNTAQQFNTLFGTTLQQYTPDSSGTGPQYDFVFWNGNLSLPEEWNVKGLWIDTNNSPGSSNMAPGASVTLPDGPQSLGNDSSSQQDRTSHAVSNLYDFPLSGLDVKTLPVGLVEIGIGTALPGNKTPPEQTKEFQELLTQFLAGNGQSGTGKVHVQGEDAQSWTYGEVSALERSLDVGVVASANPNSDITLYNGSGYTGNAGATTFTAMQSAIWERLHPTGAISSSFWDSQVMSPGSPFYEAYAQLFVDAALHNQSFFYALGDGGSGNQNGNGLTNVTYSFTNPYGVMVGGTSMSTLEAAKNDPTLKSIVDQALAGNSATIWQLMAGGLTALPSTATPTQNFIETVWNQYTVDGKQISGFDGTGYVSNNTGSGGVDLTQPAPDYQVDYGLDPVASDPTRSHGRGVPDVSANAGGNMLYTVPSPDMTGTYYDFGTSAASPLWASLAVQINTIFSDQGLPDLGYMNDLLYRASAIAPGSFNDPTMGTNTSSFVYGGPYTSDSSHVTPTGFGYAAGPDYDLVTGLGTPNGLLLARSLSAVANAQLYSKASAVMDQVGTFSGTSTVAQTFLVQNELNASTSGLAVQFAGTSVGTTTAGEAYAWTSRLAQQSLQADFDPTLVMMFDRAAQANVSTVGAGAGTLLGLSVGGVDLPLYQQPLTGDFGFVQYGGAGATYDVARPVAIAQTVGGHDDQDVIVRMRQNGLDTLRLEIYRVDDLTGKIGNLSPGQTGYDVAAIGRDYDTVTGVMVITAPGYGQFEQVQITGVDQGDILAMRLTNVTTGHTYWSFADANESSGGSKVTHLWSYGLNTWGWEDTFGGGDHDYNDLVVQLDFTGAANSAYIAGRVGGPANDILTNGAGGTSIGGSFTGNDGYDLFILRGDLKDEAITTLYPKASLITDFVVTVDGPALDRIGLSPVTAAYANISDPLAAYAPGAPVLQTVGNSGTHVALAAAEVIKLATGVATTGLTLQQAFDNAIGSAKVTGLEADKSYFFTLYDKNFSELVIGIVQDRHGESGTIEAGDVVSLVGLAPMLATDYAGLKAENFLVVSA